MFVKRDGWISFPPSEGLDGLHVRARRDNDGRLVVTQVFIDGADIITPSLLRQVSISRIEAALNAPLDTTRFADALETYTTEGSLEPDDEVTLDDLRKRSLMALHARRHTHREALTRPDGQNPEEFYQRVATAYREHALVTRAPAKHLAAEAKVPVTTVHRWIYEARRRGLLPPARKGKAG